MEAQKMSKAEREKALSSLENSGDVNIDSVMKSRILGNEVFRNVIVYMFLMQDETDCFFTSEISKKLKSTYLLINRHLNSLVEFGFLTKRKVGTFSEFKLKKDDKGKVLLTKYFELAFSKRKENLGER